MIIIFWSLRGPCAFAATNGYASACDEYVGPNLF